MKGIKLENIEQVYFSNKKVTMFKVYITEGNHWLYDGIGYVDGWYKKESTLLKKYHYFK